MRDQRMLDLMEAYASIYTNNSDVQEATGGATKKAETKFHLKLDKLVHGTFGPSPDEKKKMKEAWEGSKEDKEEDKDLAKKNGMSMKDWEKSAADKKHDKGEKETEKEGKEKESKKDEGGKHKEGKHPVGKEEPGEKVTEKEGKEKEKEMKESADLFDHILEYLVAEGYADTNKAALAIMANMSEEWKQSIMEGPVGEFADNLARTAGTAVGTVQRGAEYLKQKARNVAGTFEYARDRAASGTPEGVYPRKQQTTPAPRTSYPPQSPAPRPPARGGSLKPEQFTNPPYTTGPWSRRPEGVKPVPMPGPETYRRRQLPFGVNPGGPDSRR